VNPYQSPASTPAPDTGEANRRKTIALIPFLLIVPLTAAVVAWFVVFAGAERQPALALPLAICFPLLLFDLVICAWVVVEWLRWGEPPAFSRDGLIPSRASREFHRQLQSRPKLTCEEFYQVFFENSGIPQDFPGRLRKALERAFGMEFAQLHPDDNLLLVDDGEMDFAWVYECIEREFQIDFPRTRVRQAEDATFRVLLRDVVAAVQQSNSA
jgi:hypothetical protein